MHKLRTALINPTHLTKLNREFESAVPPLGLGFIASHIRNNGYICDIFDLSENWPLNIPMLDKEGLFGYQIYGVTSYTKNLDAAYELCSLIKSKLLNSTIIMGGPHASAVPQLVLSNCSSVDAVVINEGEEVFLRIVSQIENDLTISNIPGVMTRQSFAANENLHSESLLLLPTSILPNPARDAIISPDRNLYRNTKNGKRVRVEFFSTSRGCPKKCTFCSIIVMSPKYRTRSANDVINEIVEQYTLHPFGHVSFIDANFFADAKRALEISGKLKNFNSELTWSGTATVDQICRKPDVLIEVAKLNCIELEVGIENGSNSVLKRYNKQTNIEQNLLCIELFRSLNLRMEVDFILFDPLMNFAELLENEDFFLKAKLDGAAPSDFLFSALNLYPGTEVRTLYERIHPLPENFYGTPDFIDSQVQFVFDRQKKFAKESYDQILYIISKIDNKLDSYFENEFHDLNLLLLSIALIRARHLPFLFFQSSLRLAEKYKTEIKGKYFNSFEFVRNTYQKSLGLLFFEPDFNAFVCAPQNQIGLTTSGILNIRETYYLVGIFKRPVEIEGIEKVFVHINQHVCVQLDCDFRFYPFNQKEENLFCELYRNDIHESFYLKAV